MTHYLLFTIHASHNRRGVTLIEFLIYLAVVGLLLTSFIFIAQSVTEARIRSRAMKEVTQNAQGALQRISLAARRAHGISPGSSFGTDIAALGGFAGFLLDEQKENPTIFIVQNDTLWILENLSSLSFLPLTSDDVAVTHLTFEDFSSADARTQNVGVTISVEYRNPNSISSLVASTTLQSAFELRDPS